MIALLRSAWPYLAGIALLVGTCLGIDHHGYTRGYAAKNAEVVKAALRLAEKADQVRTTLDTLAGQAAAAQRDQQTSTKDIYHEAIRIVDRPVYRNLCVDADGVGLLDRAAAVANRGFAFSPPDRAAGAARDAAR